MADYNIRYGNYSMRDKSAKVIVASTRLFFFFFFSYRRSQREEATGV